MLARRRSRIAACLLLFLLALLPSHAMALTLPNPPDTTAPANNQSGSLPNSMSFSGGVSLVDDGTTQQNESGTEFVAEYLCIGHPLSLTKLYATTIGESISGPLTGAQASGVISAMNSVRPPSAVALSIPIGGLDLGGNITYVESAMLYNVTTYSVWVTQQSSAAIQRVGYIVIGIPVKPYVMRDFYDMSGSSCDSYGMSKLGAGFDDGPPEVDYEYNQYGNLENNAQPNAISVANPLNPFSSPPANGFGPIFTYGTVKVLSSSGVAGAGVIRPGENMTFVLPPGSYSAVADVTFFGIPFGVPSGTYSSAPGASTAEFTVSLASLDGLWYGLELAGLAVLLFVLWILARFFRLREVLSSASKRIVKAARTGRRIVWDSD